MQSTANQIWLPVGAILAGISVLLGAFGAHGLENYLEDKYAGEPTVQVERLDNWITAARYQMYHAVGLMLIGCSAGWARLRLARLAALSMILGILVFSGCLYLLVLSGQTILGAIVPLGGVAQIVGWALLAAATWPKK